MSCFTPPAIYLRDDRVGIPPSSAGHAGIVSETSRLIELSPIHIARAPILRPGLPLAPSLAIHAVAIGMMHAAKGFEFCAAALVGCDSRHMPLSDARSRADGYDTRWLVEEGVRRCCTSAASARESLLITYAGRGESLSQSDGRVAN